MLLISSRKFTHLGDCLFSLDLSTLELKSRCSHPVPATFQSESRLLRRRARVFMCFSFLHIANLRKNPEGSVFPSGFYDNLRKSCGSAALLCQCLMDQNRPLVYNTKFKDYTKTLQRYNLLWEFTNFLEKKINDPLIPRGERSNLPGLPVPATC